MTVAGLCEARVPVESIGFPGSTFYHGSLARRSNNDDHHLRRWDIMPNLGDFAMTLCARPVCIATKRLEC
jgi:hypothetical protein